MTFRIRCGRRKVGETGYSRKLLADAARAHGIDLAKARTPVITSAAWLRAHYDKQRKSTAQIARELGTSQMAVNRALHQLGIPPRPTGVHSSPQMLARLDRRLSADLRSAVEGGLDGWQRLHRFQIAMAFPTLADAAQHLRAPKQALVLQTQRLERDIGVRLFHRATSATPQRPTRRGQRLLDNLAKEHVHALMTKALTPEDLERRTGHQDAAAATQFPRPRRPITPFESVPITRLPITSALLDLLDDLRVHPEHQCYGALILSRTGRDAGNTYEQLKRLQEAGWINSRTEEDESWKARATPGRGPGRRRTYYQLTPAGSEAADLERTRRTEKPPRQRNPQRP